MLQVYNTFVSNIFIITNTWHLASMSQCPFLFLHTFYEACIVDLMYSCSIITIVLTTKWKWRIHTKATTADSGQQVFWLYTAACKAGSDACGQQNQCYSNIHDCMVGLMSVWGEDMTNWKHNMLNTIGLITVCVIDCASMKA